MKRSLALPFFLLAAAACPVPGRAQEQPGLALTTDTPAYCAQLARQVEARHSTMMDVQRLLAEGRQMCDHGEIMGGVKRLRRALVLLHHKTARPGAAPE